MFINNSSSFHSVQLGCSLFAFRKIVIKHQLWREILIISRNVELSNCVATSAAKCQGLFYCGFRWTLARGKQEQHQDNSWVTMLPNKWWSTSEYSYLKTFETSPCWMYCLIKGSCNHEPMTHNFFFQQQQIRIDYKCQINCICTLPWLRCKQLPDQILAVSVLEDIMNASKYILLTVVEQLENSFDVCLNKVPCFGRMGNIDGSGNVVCRVITFNQ